MGISLPLPEEIPDYGDHMTLDELKRNVDSGMFIDYDGYGCLATIDKMVNITISPSSLTEEKVSELKSSGWTHVVWFNK